MNYVYKPEDEVRIVNDIRRDPTDKRDPVAEVHKRARACGIGEYDELETLAEEVEA